MFGAITITINGHLDPRGRRESTSGSFVRINNDIIKTELRVIDHNGEMVGVLSKAEALKMAEKVGLDLVEVSPNATPPVCKIIDYGKYKFDQQKKKAEAKKKQKVVEVKEIQLRPMIGKHDLDIKIKAITRFIEAENKVKIVMRFRGREMSNKQIGARILEEIRTIFDEKVKIELMPKFEGNQMIMIFAPNPERKK